MAPLLFRGVKLSCTSPAATATCTSIDYRRSVVRPGGRTLDRQIPHLIRDAGSRARALNSAPHSPSKPKSHLQKSRKSLEKPSTDLISPAGSSRYLLDDEAFFDVFPDLDTIPALIPIESARFHSAKGDESAALKPTYSSSLSPRISQDSVYFRASTSSSSSLPSSRFQSVKGDDDSLSLKPSSSTRVQEMGYPRSSTSSSLPSVRFQSSVYKRDDSPVLKSPSSTRALEMGYSRASTTSSSPSERFHAIKRDESAVSKPSPLVRSQDRSFFRASSSLSTTRFQTIEGAHDESVVLKPSASARSRDQVVVLRVSLHCKGCEGKVRKHISRMEGVTSFNIDFATKKVTVIGDVTPLGVLSSVSKVKNAQFWPSPTRSSSSSS